MFIESKEKEKTSKMKGRAERKLKGLEAAEKKEKSGIQKIEQGENLAFPCHLHQPLVRDAKRYSRITGCSAEAVWNGGTKIVPVGKEVTASCVTAAKFNACALLSTQVSKSPHFANFFQSITAKSTYVSCQLLCLTFVANRWIKLACTLNSFMTYHPSGLVENLLNVTFYGPPPCHPPPPQHNV
jgi:hypothetical protein